MTDSSSELKVLVTLSRHGSRAPNAIAKRLCPKNAANAQAYQVPPAQLTEKGMEQLRLAGDHIRHEYVERQKFLSPSIAGPERLHFETYFRADSADRCGQSALSLGYGLYPDKTGPKGFSKQPIAIYMQLLQNEHEFAATEGPCAAVAKADDLRYEQSRAQDLLREKKALLDTVGALCGVDIPSIPSMPHGEDVITGIKDIADAFTFDAQAGLPPLPGLTPEVRAEMEQLAFTNLMERYYSTPEQVTYWVGGFGDLLLKNLNQATQPTPLAYKYYSYHGHRELLHGLGKLLGWDFHFDGLPVALNTSSLHPGTTMTFEVRERKSHLFVNTFVWSPQTGRDAVRLTKCSAMDCPLDEFNGIFKSQLELTGSYLDICAPKDTLATSSVDDGAAIEDYDSILLTVAPFIALVVFVAMAIHSATRRTQRHVEYRGLP
ncbi:hypothetical protein SPRG_05951 [Saprolegnia parasitica CBS 223.65]|uniref:Acid phosphatase n=1 Tax=Saprolegnia parasitica (strain CBS 223.65) TaxID=695850 RepID=A0A067CF74_SAPPC|nr:hypothetical protein SPRG_05951 [Saprolegnia parasitica CBS 223.65]KDO29414.1 hypothetical protein SPRG_05951 [Saprolegnia parasitica CBS 223.65]|eukprot:XP_012199916.1 hypothetical protein SPRG_05951 [Saprolegnia parasitica CBS 223.65]